MKALSYEEFFSRVAKTMKSRGLKAVRTSGTMLAALAGVDTHVAWRMKSEAAARGEPLSDLLTLEEAQERAQKKK